MGTKKNKSLHILWLLWLKLNVKINKKSGCIISNKHHPLTLSSSFIFTLILHISTVHLLLSSSLCAVHISRSVGVLSEINNSMAVGLWGCFLCDWLFSPQVHTGLFELCFMPLVAWGQRSSWSQTSLAAARLTAFMCVLSSSCISDMQH